MNARELEELFAAHFAGALDEAGATRLEEALATEPQAAQRFAALAAVEGLLRARAASPAATQELIRRVMRSVRSERSKRRFTAQVMTQLPPEPRRRWLLPAGVAAAVLLASVSAVWLLRNRAQEREIAGRLVASSDAKEFQTQFKYGACLQTGKDDRLMAELADGSGISLTPESRLVPVASRTLRLDFGGVRVKCKADKANPFTVSACGTEVMATGTEFSVNVEEEAPGTVGPLPAEPPPGTKKEDTKMSRKLVIVVVFSGMVLITNRFGSAQAGESGKVEVRPGAAPAAAAEAPAREPESPPKADPLLKKLNFEFVQTPLSEVCNFLTQVSGGIEVKCDKALADKSITLRMNQATLSLVLDWIAVLVGGEAVPERDGSNNVVSVNIAVKKAGAGRIAEKPEASKPATDPEWIKEIKEKLAKKVNFEFAQAPLAEAINFLRTISDLNMILDPAVKADEKSVTLKGEGLTLGEALDKILDQAGLRREYRNGAVFITSKEPAKKDAKKPAPEPKKDVDVF